MHCLASVVALWVTTAWWPSLLPVVAGVACFGGIIRFVFKVSESLYSEVTGITLTVSCFAAAVMWKVPEDQRVVFAIIIMAEAALIAIFALPKRNHPQYRGWFEIVVVIMAAWGIILAPISLYPNVIFGTAAAVAALATLANRVVHSVRYWAVG